MDKAKSAVKNFVSKGGHNDTTVDERMAPAVTSETINKKHHEEQTAAIDREVHQDHYHTSVQPVQDRDVLPEKHEHRMMPVEHHEHHHGKDQAIKDSLDTERAKFRDTRTEGSTTETHSTAPTVAGEHVHHHVHEVVQPVVHKETVQPSVTHTTVPIHEVHHHDPKHHGTSELPPISMSDFKNQGGKLDGREERYEQFNGEPRPAGSNPASGPHNSNLANKADPRVDSDRDGSRNMGLAQTQTPPKQAVPAESNVTNPHHDPIRQDSTTTTSTNGERRKPSLLDKLNPKKDADGDGKAGFMH